MDIFLKGFIDEFGWMNSGTHTSLTKPTLHVRTEEDAQKIKNMDDSFNIVVEE